VKGGKTTYAKLKRPIPLHIVYMTAWVDEQGIANFRNDVYSRDKGVTIPPGLLAPTLLAEQPADAPAPARQGNNK
jgi:L,D-transpeptidase YcbB